MPRMMRTRDRFRKLREIRPGIFAQVGTQMGRPRGAIFKQVMLVGGRQAIVSVVGKAGYLPVKSYEELCR